MTAVRRYTGEQFRPLGPLADDDKEYFRAAGVLEKKLEPTPPSSALPHDHPAARLLASPSAVFAERGQWPMPTGLAEGVDLLADARTSWLEDRARRVGGPWCDSRSREADLLRAVSNWPMPFPVGAACLEWTKEQFGPLRELMPFAGNVHAVAILPEMVNRHEIVTFVLAERSPTSELPPFRTMCDGQWEQFNLANWMAADVWVFTGEILQTIDGQQDLTPDPVTWVRKLAGLHHGRGRPPDPQKVQNDIASMLDKLVAYRDEQITTRGRWFEKRPPSLSTFLDFAYPENTEESANQRWHQLSQASGLSWLDVCRMVYGTATKLQRIKRGPRSRRISRHSRTK